MYLVFLFNQFCFKLILIRIYFASGCLWMSEQKGEADEERNDVGGLKEHGPTSFSTVPQFQPAVNLCKIVHKAGVLCIMAASGFSLFKTLGITYTAREGHGRPFPLCLQTIPGAVPEGDSVKWKLS